MILIGEIRRGFLEEVALHLALKDRSSTHRKVGKGYKPRQHEQWVKAVWRWQEDEEEL